METIARRVERSAERVGQAMVARYRAEIVDYAALDEAIVHSDVLDISTHNLRSLIANLQSGDEVLRPEQLDESRDGAARRVHQGVSLESLLHAYRLWGACVWDAVLDAARVDLAEEREAALRIAGRVIRHIDLVSTAAAQAYIDEAQSVWTDRELVRRELLDALLGGLADPDAARRQGASLDLDLRDTYVAVVARGREASLEALSVREAMRCTVDTALRSLRPTTGSLLVGIRQGEVVALYPVEEIGGVDRVRHECSALAESVAADGFSVGIGGWHPGPAGVSTSYAEAREAAAIAVGATTHGRAVAFDDVLINHILRSSPYSSRVLADTLGPLRAYDTEHGSELVPTIRAYFNSNFNLTRSATELRVHPNTVVYRLKRIRELTGRDPNDPNDLLLLLLGLKLADSAGPDRRPGA